MGEEHGDDGAVRQRTQEGPPRADLIRRQSRARDARRTSPTVEGSAVPSRAVALRRATDASADAAPRRRVSGIRKKAHTRSTSASAPAPSGGAHAPNLGECATEERAQDEARG